MNRTTMKSLRFSLPQSFIACEIIHVPVIICLAENYDASQGDDIDKLVPYCSYSYAIQRGNFTQEIKNVCQSHMQKLQSDKIASNFSGQKNILLISHGGTIFGITKSSLLWPYIPKFKTVSLHPNSMDSSCDRMEKWKKRWEENQLRWHKDEVDPFLVNYLTKLQEKEKSESKVVPTSKRFFVPLCGKSLDVAYILSMGYSVFAVEGVRKAIETLNSDNDLELEFCEQESIFRSPEGKVQIYFGDLFTCPIEKWAPFDYVWDKGSLTAIDEECRQGYKTVIRKSVQVPGSNLEYADFNYLLRTVQYDKAKWDGKGPKCVSESDMEELYGDWANITLVKSTPLPDTHICKMNVNIGLVCHENIYLLTKKK